MIPTGTEQASNCILYNKGLRYLYRYRSKHDAMVPCGVRKFSNKFWIRFPKSEYGFVDRVEPGSNLGPKHLYQNGRTAPTRIICPFLLSNFL
jgi:hypothetical protein